MTNKYIKLALPVRVDGDNDLVNTEGFCVAYEGNVAPYNAVMIEVAKCVNYHHRLREALEDCRRTVEATHKARVGGGDLNQALAAQEVAERKADALLAELDSLEDRGHE